MSDTFRRHAIELRKKAAQERHPARQKYLSGLAASYEELSRQRGEPAPPEPPAVMSRADRAALALTLRGRGYTQAHIAERLNCSQQLVSQLLGERTNGGGANADAGHDEREANAASAS